MSITHTFRIIIAASLYFAMGLPLAWTQETIGPVQAGDNILQFGLGTGGPWLIKFDQTSASPLFQLNYEKVLADVPGTGMIGIGGYLGYKTLRQESSLGTGSYFYYDQHYTVIPVGLRVTTHYWLGMNKLDTYGGVGAGMNIVSRIIKDEAAGGNLFTEEDVVKSYFAYSLFVGARYTVTDRVGVWTELAYGNAYINFGASLKF